MRLKEWKAWTVVVPLVLVSVWMGTAKADPIAVTNYSWLQLRATSVIGYTGDSAGGTAGAGYGYQDSFRWGDRVWIPSVYSPNGTNRGTNDYWAVLRLDQPRQIKTIRVQWWALENTSLKAYRVELSNDGSTWSQVAYTNYGTFKTGDPFQDDLDIPDQDARYIRVKVLAGDYTHRDPALGGDRGGPGLMAIEPVGDGVVDSQSINWANNGNFGTTASNNGLDFSGLGYIDGLLWYRGGGRAGDTANWEVGDYAQIDLKVKRRVDTVVTVRENYYSFTGFNVSYSLDGITFTDVPNKRAVISHSNYTATEVDFDVVEARYIRIKDATQTSGYAIMKQALVLGGPPPPPGALISLR